ncbi:hypothetical protein F2P56_017973 [Juglans regia]|uniref:VQ motif-containing protein 9-like n=2 Tax=Juglans regia TaxID=51240 RepID=A0A2I4DN71_JUGRE|nr:VQ motif-containing protein 9-like [Juglans regia]KAF5461913.1 hypothetical protein F2P56_017973 [Juglans regia]
MMDKSCQSTTITAATTSATTNSNGSNNNTNRDQYLRHLNMLSHKISKPSIKKSSTDPVNQSQSHQNHPQSQPASQQPQVQQQIQAQAQQQHQPPVYNINKNDFRDVVQKLTGSPVHRRFSTPQPIQAPRPPSSRLHRIRPPPLAHVCNRPPPLLDSGDLRAQQPIINPNIPITAPTSSFGQFGQPITPLSPLPPFPSVHTVAESPVSAHMRYLQNPVSTVDSNPTQFSRFSPLAPLVLPRWNNLIPPPHQGLTPPPSATIPSQPQFPMPTSPLPFGCFNSPRSPYPLLSPGLLFSPSPGQLGFPQLPLSPTVQVESPRWRAV